MRRATAVIVLLTLVTVLVATPTARAVDPGATGGDIAPSANGDGTISTPTQETPQTEPAPSFLEIAVAGLVNFLYDGIYAIGFQPIETLVFGVTKSDSTSADSGWGIFSEREMSNVIVPWVHWMQVLAWGFTAIAIVASGVKLASAGMNPRNRAEVQHEIWNWLVAALLVSSTLPICSLIFGANRAIVQTLCSISGGEAGLSSIGIIGSQSGNLLTTALIKLLGLGATVYLNFLYMLRYFSLMVLVIIGPVIGYFWYYDRGKPVVGAWFKELLANISMQTVHALMFAIFFTLTRGAVNPMVRVWFLFCLIPVSDAVRALIGIQGWDGRSKYASLAIGMGSVAGVLGLASQAMGVRSDSASLPGMLGKTPLTDLGRQAGRATASAVSAVSSGGGGATARFLQERAAKIGGPVGGLTQVQNARRAASLVGQVVGGVAGAVVGLGMGDPGMIEAGARAGAAFLGSTMAAGAGTRAAAQFIRSNFREHGVTGAVAARALAGNAQAREQVSKAWEKIQTAFGAQDWMTDAAKRHVVAHNLGHILGHAVAGAPGGHALAHFAESRIRHTDLGIANYPEGLAPNPGDRITVVTDVYGSYMYLNGDYSKPIGFDADATGPFTPDSPQVMDFVAEQSKVDPKQVVWRHEGTHIAQGNVYQTPATVTSSAAFLSAVHRP